MRNPVLLPALMSVLLLPAFAQTERQGPMRMPGDNVIGKVIAVAKDSITVAPARGGDPVTIKVDDNTRVVKERQPIKLSEIKVDDTIFARGKLDGNTLQAGMLGVVSPEMAQRMQQGGGVIMGPGAGGRMQFKPEDWGKTFIAGRVKAIHETTLTIARPEDSQSLNIEVDENTSFKKGRESITLADIKADDFVMGQGEVKNGVFVAKELRVGGGRMMGQRGPASDENKTDGNQPPSPPKN